MPTEVVKEGLHEYTLLDRLPRSRLRDKALCERTATLRKKNETAQCTNVKNKRVGRGKENRDTHLELRPLSRVQ